MRVKFLAQGNNMSLFDRVKNSLSDKVSLDKNQELNNYSRIYGLV